jgi:transcriptional regulator with XRE-family HTH domain
VSFFSKKDGEQGPRQTARVSAPVEVGEEYAPGYRRVKMHIDLPDDASDRGDKIAPPTRTKYLGPDEPGRFLHRVRRLRTERGLSVAELAEQSGADADLIEDIESGDEQRAPDRYLRKLARVLTDGDVDALAPWAIRDDEAIEAEAVIPEPQRPTPDPSATPPPFRGDQHTVPDYSPPETAERAKQSVRRQATEREVESIRADAAKLRREIQLADSAESIRELRGKVSELAAEANSRDDIRAKLDNGMGALAQVTRHFGRS